MTRSFTTSTPTSIWYDGGNRRIMFHYYKFREGGPRPGEDEVFAEDAEVGESLGRIEMATHKVFEEMNFDEGRNPQSQGAEFIEKLTDAWKATGDTRSPVDMQAAAVREYTRWVNKEKMDAMRGRSETPNRDAFYEAFPNLERKGVEVTFDTSEFKDASGEWIEEDRDNSDQKAA